MHLGYRNPFPPKNDFPIKCNAQKTLPKVRYGRKDSCMEGTNVCFSIRAFIRFSHRTF